MKTYFVKYLPVEGEIKVGGFVADTFAMGAVSKVTKIDGFRVETEDGFSSDYRQYYKNVKLFLCSRDIQVGDKDLKIDGTPYSSTLPVLDKLDLEALKAYNAYKVIGEISPQAVWVKEGDEFDESEVKFHYRDKFECKCETVQWWTTSNKCEHEEEDNYNNAYCCFRKVQGDVWKVDLKGPCGYFH